jgi:hypothetical protein
VEELFYVIFWLAGIVIEAIVAVMVTGNTITPHSRPGVVRRRKHS